MRWSDLSPVWHACLEEAWQAYKCGSVPIGAVIAGPKGEIISRGRNHIYDDTQLSGQVSRNQLAHAELNALLHFDRNLHNQRSCAIYTSMEPCPLCMGAIYMMGIGEVHFAARDAYAGSTNLLGTTEYYSRKDIRAHGPSFLELESVSIALIIAFDLSHRNLPFHARMPEVLAEWQKVCPDGVSFGFQLWEEDNLRKAAQAGATAQQAFDLMFFEMENIH